jgi:hypothetical protein
LKAEEGGVGGMEKRVACIVAGPVVVFAWATCFLAAWKIATKFIISDLLVLAKN